MRRIFLAGLAAVLLAATPFASSAQERLPVVGFLSPTSPGNLAEIPPLLEGMAALGYVEGRDFTLVARYLEGGGPQPSQAIADELIALGPDVIFATPVRYVMAATETIPIVTLALGPVGFEARVATSDALNLTSPASSRISSPLPQSLSSWQKT